MAEAWTAETLVSGRRVSRESVMLFGGTDAEGIPINVQFWLLRGHGRTVLIDTGLRPVPLPGNEWKFQQGPGEDTASLLLALGVDPTDVDAVVISHLHHDHAESAGLFSRAEIVISRRGWEHWQRERGALRLPLYPLDLIEAWEQGALGDRLRLAEDEETILPGLRVAWTGGHTPCSQLVFVDTPAGRAVFTGDESFLYRNVEQDVPVGLHADLGRARAALVRAREDADFPVPSHDPEVLLRHPGGRIG